MKTLVYILFFTSTCYSAFAQSINQGQLYAEPAENIIDINLNKTLNYSWTIVDDFVIGTNAENFASFGNLAIYLTKQFYEERSKARSIYTWIALNISYDQQSILSAPDESTQSAQRVWISRVAVCEGFANLYHEMCKAAGLESRIIKGYVKNFTDLDFRFPNHAWNSVKIDGKWQLLDATWASVNNEGTLLANANLQKSYARHKLDYFFLVSPKKMILTHLPEDPYWQLQSNYIDMETFRKGESYIKTTLMNPISKLDDFEKLIADYDKLDSLDRSISYLERMESNEWNRAKEYGLGIAYYYKAQKILNKASKGNRTQAIERAKKYYKKSLDQLTILQEEDYGYEISRDLANSVALRIESLQ